MRKSAQVAIKKRYARWLMASPSAKYSTSASSVTSATASETIAVELPSTRPTTNGIKTTAVATRFQVIDRESPEKPASARRARLPRRAALPHLITSREISHVIQAGQTFVRQRRPWQ